MAEYWALVDTAGGFDLGAPSEFFAAPGLRDGRITGPARSGFWKVGRALRGGGDMTESPVS